MEKKETKITNYKGNGQYAYSAQDGSFGDLYITVPLATKLVEKLPWWLPANIITIISNSNVLLAFVITLTAHRVNWPIWIFIPILFFIYVVGDATDGMQARRTKTGSPLGEFTDHFLDTFVTGILEVSVFYVYSCTKVYMVSFVLMLGYFLQITAFWERYKLGHLSFGKISSTDAIIFLSLFIAAGFIKPVNAFFTQPAANFIPFLGQFNLSVIEAITIVLAACSIFVSGATLARAKEVSWRFWLYMAESFILSFVAATLEQDDIIIVIITLVLFHVNYSAALLSTIVVNEKDPVPDILLTIAMTLSLLFNVHSPILYTVYFVYLVISVTIRVARFFKKNEKYWVWKNPELNDEAAKTKN